MIVSFREPAQNLMFKRIGLNKLVQDFCPQGINPFGQDDDLELISSC